MKKILLLFIVFIILFYFICCPSQALNASKSGIMIWFDKIFPVLFPCIIISNIVIGSNVLSYSKYCPYIIAICGFFCGFPVGCKLTTDFYKGNIISKDMAQRLCNYTNQLSVIYIQCFVVGQCLKNIIDTTVFLAVVYFPPICALLISLIKYNNVQKKSASRFRLNMQIIDAGIISGFETLIKLCGYIVLFSILFSIFNNIVKESIIKYALLGLIENVNGIIILSNQGISSSAEILLAIAFVSFGGICCMMQTASIIKGTDLSIGKYMLSKIITTCISTILAFIYLFCFNLI